MTTRRRARSARRALAPLAQAERDGDLGAAAGDGHALARSLEGQREPGDVEEARRGDDAGLAGGGGEADAPRAADALHGARAHPQLRRDAVVAGRRAGRRRDGDARDDLAVGPDVVEGVGLDAVLARAAADGVADAVAHAQLVGAGAGVEAVGALVAGQDVVGDARPQRVRARPAEDAGGDRRLDGHGVLALADLELHDRGAAARAEGLDDPLVRVVRRLPRVAAAEVHAAVDRAVEELDAVAREADGERVQRGGVGRDVADLLAARAHERVGGGGCRGQRREGEGGEGREAHVTVIVYGSRGRGGRNPQARPRRRRSRARAAARPGARAGRPCAASGAAARRRGPR